MKTALLIPVLTQIMQDFKGRVEVIYSFILASTTHIHPAFTLRLQAFIAEVTCQKSVISLSLQDLGGQGGTGAGFSSSWFASAHYRFTILPCLPLVSV